MRKVSIDEAKTTLSQLVEAAEAGETVVLARAGKPVVELKRLKKNRGIKLGVLKGMFPEAFLAAADKPLSPQDIERLVATGIEP